MKFFVAQAATGFGLGQIPFMPGTFGSLLDLPLAWWLLCQPLRWQALIAVILLALAVLLCHWLRCGWSGDIPQIVADKHRGCSVSVMGLASIRRS